MPMAQVMLTSSSPRDMTKLQSIVLAIALLLFSVLYFGFDTKPSSRMAIERTRSLTTESTDINVILPEAKVNLSPDEAAIIGSLEQALNDTSVDSVRIGLLEKLSGSWYDLRRPDIAGHYAEVIADKVNSSEAWSIAGTTYAIGAQRLDEKKIRSYCSGRAIKSFENAISLDPKEIKHQVNLALCYTDNPPEGNPMKGIQMLLGLSKENPEESLVQTTLARLAIKTGQFDKAIKRLDSVLETDKLNRIAPCLLAKAYEGKGDTNKAAAYLEKCNANTTN